ncbi:hypothetical protein BZG36_02783 [Bifiguratus adelaidae]|uniref:U3 small nucleolar RNA-associated protein 11 n=1 Tax=Bifiguratus adelaidae TaxID=1938954 RepID=A0A261Y1W0_9FUNG|nr:hypothetical protein BZG36_02783 [Bifiguratus adelaidae]
MSASLRNVVQRRNHKERGQLAHRQKYGLLEKKKDYKLRAKDYHFKEDRIKALKTRAAFRNPDEFYFKMVNAKTKNGVHAAERNAALPPEMVQLMKSQDKNYIKFQRDRSKKKLEKLQESIHFVPDDELEQDEPTPKHTLFVDSEKEMRTFDPAKHFDTLPELVGRTFNRPRRETLRQAAFQPRDEEEIKAVERAHDQRFREVLSREEREVQLSKTEHELRLQHALQAKGRKVNVGTDAYGLPKYKWKNDRKR